MPRSIVVIHGVGQSILSTVGAELANTLGLSISTQKTITVNGEKYIEFEDEKTTDSIIEVNWADILRPKNNIIGVIRHFWLLLTCMLDVSVDPKQDGSRLIFTQLYRWALFTFSLGSSFFTFSTVIAICVCDRYERILFFTILIGSLSFITIWTRKQGMYFIWLWPWVGAITILCFYTIKEPLEDYKLLMIWARFFREAGFLAVIILLPISILESWISLKNNTVRLTHCTLRIIPFIAMNGFFAWTIFLGLGMISNLENVQRYEDWEMSLAPKFNMAQMELVSTVVFTIIAILSFGIPLLRFQIAKSKHNKTVPLNVKGKAAQDGFVLFLILAPAILIGLEVYCFWLMLYSKPTSDGILEIYRISIIRTLPLLLWFIGPLSIVLDVAGDILFYLQPLKSHPAYILDKCKNRVLNAVRYAQQKTERDIVILAHSQGSVIAVDLLREEKIINRLITIGSPIDALYYRFLGISKSENLISWQNLFRDGDMLGGPITGVYNENIGEGGHTNYWNDAALNKYVHF